MREFFDWFIQDPFRNTLLICVCLSMGSCTAHSIYVEWHPLSCHLEQKSGAERSKEGIKVWEDGKDKSVTL